ncbi:hypothetical protein Micbo1qcDRAFT_161771 [Microdochium bolleyi]|uniref:Uncharacterized protein n=1 Tax=Microdochium bolleyi TaxID=196109 RepID=A0A136J3R9_9PEZI|nr:hypothetical protein Micbo1qcDRAFT_161771 [Microdochium bolleyi]
MPRDRCTTPVPSAGTCALGTAVLVSFFAELSSSLFFSVSHVLSPVAATFHIVVLLRPASSHSS